MKKREKMMKRMKRMKIRVIKRNWVNLRMGFEIYLQVLWRKLWSSLKWKDRGGRIPLFEQKRYFR